MDTRIVHRPDAKRCKNSHSTSQKEREQRTDDDGDNCPSSPPLIGTVVKPEIIIRRHKESTLEEISFCMAREAIKEPISSKLIQPVEDIQVHTLYRLKHYYPLRDERDLSDGPSFSNKILY